MLFLACISLACIRQQSPCESRNSAALFPDVKVHKAQDERSAKGNWPWLLFGAGCTAFRADAVVLQLCREWREWRHNAEFESQLYFLFFFWKKNNIFLTSQQKLWPRIGAGAISLDQPHNYRRRELFNTMLYSVREEMCVMGCVSLTGVYIKCELSWLSVTQVQSQPCHFGPLCSTVYLRQGCFISASQSTYCM